MTHHNSIDNNHQKRHRALELYRNPILWAIAVSLLPTIVLLVISYFHAIASAKTNLAGIIKTAATKTDRLLADADAILHRSNIDLQDADNKTAVKILQRQIYNDFRFREAGIINTKGLLTLSSLGVVDPPKPASLTKIRFNSSDPELQILGPGKTQIMQERSIALMLRGSGKIGGLYLLVDPVILTSFLEAIPDLDLGTNGFIVFMTSDKHLMGAIGMPPQNIFSTLQNPSFNTLQVIRTTQDGKIAIVGKVSRKWALRYWLQELLVIAPIAVLISGLLSYLFIRQVRQSHTLDYELRRGLIQKEFEVHYQPILDLETRQCVGSEALLRWRHSQRGMIYPGLFIPIAEQTGFIVPLTEWLLEKVIQERAMLESKFQNLYVSINLSPTQLNAGDVERLIKTLKEANHHSKVSIVFEITENKLIEEQEQVVQDAISRLKQWGIRFAIDDFGTGYSNIGYLQKLDVDLLKLDRLFIKGLEQGDRTNQLVDSLIDFGARMGLTIVAEGIETETQYQYLKDRGVQYGQGWLFSRPLPYEDFERFLQAQNS